MGGSSFGELKGRMEEERKKRISILLLPRILLNNYTISYIWISG